MRTPLTNDAELQARDQLFLFRQHSYDLTQKLTYFVISVELVFCGYMLLNADKLTGIKGASYLFVACGAAAFFGIFWRFFYNQTYHDHAHGVRGLLNQIAHRAQVVCYWIYVVLSIASFVWALMAGFAYLNKLNGIPKTTASAKTNQSTSISVHVGQPLSPNPAKIKINSQNEPVLKAKENAAETKRATTAN